MSIVAVNQLKQTVQNGGAEVGTMLAEIRQPAVMQLLANADFDFVIIDNEHGGFSIESIADLSRTAKFVGLTPIVRVPEVSYTHVVQSLDVGAQGVMLPRINSLQQVEAAIAMMKFPPLGERGSALSRGLTDFRSGPIVDALARLNEESMLIVQIESRGALESVEAIASLPGVDALLIGPNDLAISLDVPGQFESDEMKSAITRVIEACQTHNVCPGIHMNDLDLAISWIKAGMRLISSGSETSLMMKAGTELTTHLRHALEAV